MLVRLFSAYIPGSHLARGSPALHPMLGDGFSHEGQVRLTEI